MSIVVPTIVPIVISQPGALSALSLMQDAFELLKIYAPGRQLNAADSALGLKVINKMLGSWSNQKWACYANTEIALPLVPGKNRYTIGPSGDVSVTRPIEIATGPGAAYLVDDNQNRYPVTVIQQDEWNQIGLLTTQTQLPDTIFYDPQMPLGIMNVYGMPMSSYTIYFDARLQFSNITNLVATFSLPPGYEEAIVSNLAVRLWPYYKQGNPTPELKEQAATSLGDVKRSNIKTSPSPYDSAIISRAQSTYNIYNDSSGNRGVR